MGTKVQFHRVHPSRIRLVAVCETPITSCSILDSQLTGYHVLAPSRRSRFSGSVACLATLLLALGHSLMLLYGVLSGLHFNAFIVDAIIGLSVVYKALDNLGAFRCRFGFQPDTGMAILFFGFCHGFGLATEIQDFSLSETGLVSNILAFNLGVKIGQLLSLGAILLLMNLWRRTRGFARQAFIANGVLMSAGFMLTGYHLTGYLMLS